MTTVVFAGRTILFRGIRVEKIKNFFEIKTKLGLALSGGGARAIAHIGLLKSFEDHRIKISSISGTSAGAFVAALFAFGKTADEIRTVFESLTFAKISNILPNKFGLSANLGVSEILTETIGLVNIEDAKIPLAILCTDLISGEKRTFTSGPVNKIVQASCSLPGLFSPVEYDNMILVDGALTENVPVSAVKTLGANFVIAVNLSDNKKHRKVPKGMMDVLGRSFDILVDTASEHKIKDATHTLHMDLSFMSPFKLTNSEKGFLIGYNETQKVLSKPLLYWWFKPFSDYTLECIYYLSKLLKSALTHPRLRGTLFFSVNYMKRIQRKLINLLSREQI